MGKEIGTLAGGFTGGAMGLGAGMVAASLALIPGIGQVFAVGAGAAALLGFIGTKTGAKVGKSIAKEPGVPAPTADEKASEDVQLFLEVLEMGRSLIVVRTESAAIAKVASGVLDRANSSAPPRVSRKMQAGVRQVSPGVTAVDVRGRIVVGEGNVLLRETIQKLVDGGNIKVLLIMQEVEHIDSSGIGEIVRAHAMIRRLSGQLKVVSPSAKVQEMLQMTMLQRVLDVHKDEASAIESFAASSTSAGLPESPNVAHLFRAAASSVAGLGRRNSVSVSEIAQKPRCLTSPFPESAESLTYVLAQSAQPCLKKNYFRALVPYSGLSGF